MRSACALCSVLLVVAACSDEVSSPTTPGIRQSTVASSLTHPPTPYTVELGAALGSTTHPQHVVVNAANDITVNINSPTFTPEKLVEFVGGSELQIGVQAEEQSANFHDLKYSANGALIYLSGIDANYNLGVVVIQGAGVSGENNYQAIYPDEFYSIVPSTDDSKLYGLTANGHLYRFPLTHGTLDSVKIGSGNNPTSHSLVFAKGTDTQAYAAVTNDAKVVAVDLNNLTITHTTQLPSGSRPGELALSSDGTALYVLDEDNGKLYRIAEPAGTLSAMSTLAGDNISRLNMMFTPDGTQLWYTASTGFVNVVDPRKMKITASINLNTAENASADPFGIAFAKGGAEAVVADEVTGNIVVIK